MPNALERLERWKYGHKSRSVSIDIDNGYGATCWTVTLYEGKKETTVCSFLSDGGFPASPNAYGARSRDDEDDPTLEQTILEALRRAGEEKA